MKQLVGEPARKRFEHLFRRRSAGEQPPCAFELHGAECVMMVRQGSNRRHDAAPFEPAQEMGALLGDHLFGLHNGLAADLQIVLHDLGQIVDAVEKYIGQCARLGLYIAWHSEIDDENRRMSALLDHTFEQSLADDRQRARRARDDDVELGQAFRQFVERDRFSGKTRGELFAALHRAIGDGDRLRILRCEMRGRELDHFACADQKQPLPGDRRENAFRQFHGRSGHRDRRAADIGLRTHVLRDRERALE